MSSISQTVVNRSNYKKHSSLSGGETAVAAYPGRNFGWNHIPLTTQQNVIWIARQYGLQFNRGVDDPLGIQLLFEPVGTLTSQEIYHWAQELINSNYISIHRKFDPFVDIEDEASRFINPDRWARILYCCWKCGKIGFPFLPDPKKYSFSQYSDEVARLLRDICLNGNPRPHSILVDREDGHDKSFFESLPDKVTIYRGANGVSPEMAATGLCWTTKKDIAEWFARRFASNLEQSILLEAEVDKSEICLAFASEHEVVAKPASWRSIPLSSYPELSAPFPKEGTWKSCQ